MSRVALYSWVSTDTQESDNQLLELRQWAKSQGHTVVSEYVDVASGVHLRERLDDLLDDARCRRVDLVAIWSLDRLPRDSPLATLLYLQRITTIGIRPSRTKNRAWTPPSHFIESIVAFLADIARWERTRRSEGTKLGLQRDKAQGKRLGRPLGKKDSRKWVVRRRGWVEVPIPMAQ